MLKLPELPSSAARLRLWQAFLGGRALVALVLLCSLFMQTWGVPVDTLAPRPIAWWITSGYLLLTAITWMATRKRPLPPHLHLGWLFVVGADLAAIFSLQLLQVHSMYYTPLLVLPLLMASTLGNLLLAMVTTAAITLLLLANSIWSAWLTEPGAPTHYAQTALTCAAYFVLAYLANQLSKRLAREELRAYQHELHAQTHARVNSLIIEHLSEGVLVVDANQLVHMSNPAALRLLNGDTALYSLTEEASWAPLRALVDETFAKQQMHSSEINLLCTGQSPVGLYVRTWLTTSASLPHLHSSAEHAQASLCVMFLYDLREAQARMRTEKLAAMGRMSAAVAHEIRNPLAAIMQANALLSEDLNDPHHQRLTSMVEQNAQRLVRIAEEILDIARVQNQIQHTKAATLPLDHQAQMIWEEWRHHDPVKRVGQLHILSDDAPIEFEAEHLRRVVVNLLDNALRFISAHDDALQIVTGQQDGQSAWLQVWSDGQPLEASVERHLFEPFFSSHSRSSGLGLYICRELCQRYGASLHYQRVHRPTSRGLIEGNAFTILFRQASQPTTSPSPPAPIVV